MHERIDAFCAEAICHQKGRFVMPNPSRQTANYWPQILSTEPAQQTAGAGRQMTKADLPDFVRDLGGTPRDVARARARIARMSESEKREPIPYWFKVEASNAR